MPKNLLRWSKVGIAVSAAMLLGTCSPLPSLVDQIKTLGELRVVTRNGPLAFYRGADETPEGPEYELARLFADELGVKLKITPLRQLCGNLCRPETRGKRTWPRPD